jgi:hypothetical protein
MSGNRRLLVGMAAAVVVVGAVLVSANPFDRSAASPGATLDNGTPTSLATVTRQSLVSQTQVSATLGYASPSTVVVPSGTPPSDVQKARQLVTTDLGMLETARTTLAADTTARAQVSSSLSAALAKESVDCGGDNAAAAVSSAPTGSGSGQGGAAGSGACGGDGQTVSATEQSLSDDTAKVAADLAQMTAARATLAGDRVSLAGSEESAAVYGQSSTFTTLPHVGSIVDRGQALYSIGGEPSILLYGAVAAWRAFAPGMSAGPDVAELNANLRALGYGHHIAGDRFTAATAKAVDALQAATGIRGTGSLLLGAVVFEPGPVRVTSVTSTAGATVQPGPVLTVSSTVREVVIELDAAQQTEIKIGDAVTITLPDNHTTPGKVTFVGTVATTPSSSSSQSGGGGSGGGSGNPTIEVDVTPSDPAATGHLDQAPVNVSITTASVRNALVVPVNALLALSGGGYALEEVDASGAHHLVAARLGIFDDADGLVQVTGAGVAAGQRVVIPSQ